jgi:hypothetical protein
MNRMNKWQWQHFTNLSWYDGLIELLFRFVAKTSEPLLAAGLVISAADFLTSGALMRNNAALSMAWAWTQAIAIEASSGVVFVYALQSFKQQDQIKAWLYLVLSILLALTGGAMLLFQLVANTTGMQERMLPGSVFYGLAVLRVLVSVSYVYLCRAKTIRFTDLADVSDISEQQVTQPALALSPEVVNLLIERLDTLSVTVTQLASHPTRVPEQAQSKLETVYQEETHEHEQQEGHKQGTPALDEPLRAVYGTHYADFGDTIEAILAAHPGEQLTVREVARLSGCSTRTADKWMKRLQVPQQEGNNKRSETP